MTNPILPKAQSHIAETSRQPSREWYEFFRKLLQFIQESGADPGVIASILARLDELEQEDNFFVINGLMSIDVSGTPEAGVVQIKLDGDIESPGTSYYYGTNAAGVKSFYRVRDAEIDHLPSSTYSTIQEFVNTMHSPGTIDGPTPVIMESGIPATPIRVLAGKGMIRTADDDVSSMPFFNWAQTDFAQASDGLTRFYGVVYNAGSPVVQQRTTYNWDKDTEIPLGSAVIFPSGVAVVTANPYKTGDPITNIIQRFDAQSPAIRDNSIGGLLLGETGIRNNTLTAGRIWSRLSDYDSLAKNSSTTPMLSAFFNGTGLTVASGLTQWDNTRYNNVGAGTLVAMGANKYANLWYFISIDGTKWGWAYGTNEYNTLGAAANEGVPVYLNTNFFQQALLLGRLIFQQGAATASLIESAFNSVFTTAAINNHNDLSGLQGGAVGEYYHLTAAQYAALGNPLQFATAMHIASMRP